VKKSNPGEMAMPKAAVPARPPKLESEVSEVPAAE
jgi:hypothetical protein